MIADLILDSDPHPVFTVYSAGNLAEVAPERLSVMSWSLLGDPVERGCRAFVSRVWPSATWIRGSAYVFVGYFACRPYHNLSAFCHVARLLPGLTADHVTRSYFEDAPPPPERPGLKLGSGATALATRRIVREIAALPSRVMELSGELAELEQRADAVLDRGDALALGALVADAERALARAWELHYSVTMALVPAQALQGWVGRRLHAGWDELAPLVAGPGELIWSAARIAAAAGGDAGAAAATASFLDLPFYEVAHEHEPWRRFTRRQRPADAALDRARPDAELERVGWGMLRGPGRRLLPRLALFVGELLATREQTKSLAMSSLHLHRRLIPPLADARGVDRDDWPLLRFGELVRGEGDLAGLADARRSACARALAIELPDLYEPGRTATAGDVAATRRARGVSPGRVSGVVVDVETALEPSEAPRVLVCESADTDVQPLLPHVQGIVSARGSALSHIAILSRELSVPAVVGHALARTLTVGQWVTIDGTTGEVTTHGE